MTPIAIYVDADACPVKPEILKVAERHGLRVTLVANSGLRPSRDTMIRNIIVSAGFDAADNWIAENAEINDIVITADVPLGYAASRKVLMSPVRPAGFLTKRISAWPRRCAISASICVRPAKARATTLLSARATDRPSWKHWRSFAEGPSPSFRI